MKRSSRYSLVVDFRKNETRADVSELNVRFFNSEAIEEGLKQSQYKYKC